LTLGLRNRTQAQHHLVITRGGWLGMRQKGSIRPTQDGHGRATDVRLLEAGMPCPPGQKIMRVSPASRVNAHASVSSNVDMGAAVPIGLGTAYYLAREGGDFSHAEDQEADEVRCRIAFGPFEIDVWEAVSAVAHSQQ